jgi:DNA-binding NtrC family response regulator
MQATAHNPARILVVDDDEDVLMAVRLLLKPHFSIVRTESTPARLPELVASGLYDVLLLDMNFAIGAESGSEGLSWLSRVLEQQPRMAVVLITAHGDVDIAVEAMKRGAADFIVKPWDNARLVATLKGAPAIRQARLSAGKGGREAPPAGDVSHKLVGGSAPMKRILDLVRRAAPTDANVLVLGENGTGKELVARAIHDQSARAGEVFLSVDLGAVAASLFESELFGHKRGSFTDAREDRIGRFQAASGGTLFLDEIGNLPIALQAKLLTAIERREVTPVGANRPVPVDVRLVCATNLTAGQMADPKVFRPDLLYRINTVEIALPPLRDRREDIPALAEHFVAIYAAKYNMPVKRIRADAAERLRGHAWPGNVRALRHAVERAIILSEGTELTPDDFLMVETPGAAATDEASVNLTDLEKRAIERALQRHAGNVSHAAGELGLTRGSLYRRMEKYGL